MKKHQPMNKISSTIGKEKSKTRFNETTTMIGDINNQKTPFKKNIFDDSST